MMFENDLYIRKFPLYESLAISEFKALATSEDRLLKDDGRESLHSWFKRVFLSK